MDDHHSAPIVSFRQPHYTWSDVAEYMHPQELESITAKLRSASHSKSADHVALCDLAMGELAGVLERRRPGTRSSYQKIANNWNIHGPPAALKEKYAVIPLGYIRGFQLNVRGQTRHRKCSQGHSRLPRHDAETCGDGAASCNISCHRR